MKKAIITGFGVFGDYLSNPTETFVRDHQGKRLAGYEIESIVFPATATKELGELLVAKAKKVEAKVILSLGLSSTISGVRFELACRNWVDNSKYCSPETNNKPIITELPAKTRLRVERDVYDLRHFARDLKCMGLKLEFSRNAGGFCCNSLMFSALYELHKASANIYFAFLHLPCTHACLPPGFDSEDLILLRQSDYEKIVQVFLESIY